MKAAFALFEGFSVLDFAVFFETLSRQTTPDFHWDLCSLVTDVYTGQGIHFYPTRITSSLAEYDLVVIPGGKSALNPKEQPGLLAWLGSAGKEAWIIAVGEGVLLAAAAGLCTGKRVAALPELAGWFAQYQALVDDKPAVYDSPLFTASTPSAALELAQKLANSLLTAIPVTAGPADKAPSGRQALVERRTGETQIELKLDIDGSGQHQVETGLPFLDHMLTQVAVHGLFDLGIYAQGDLQIDPHHTLEDVALALGTAFQQALGDRAGIVRMASASCPMDESLAWVDVDFSGRPYCIFQADWHAPLVAGLPSSLFAHFFESFSFNARCNLHASVRYGRDDHHQAEALFKAFGRALCAATRLDPRRAGRVPSSKGVLF